MNKVILRIDGMSCSACSSGLEKYLNRQDGIISASVNLVLAEASIEYEDNLTLEDLDRFVSEAGFESLGVYDPRKEEKKVNKKNYFLVFACLLILLMYISMSHMIGLPAIPLLNMSTHAVNYGVFLLVLTIPFLIYGFDIIKNGIKNLLNRIPNMDSLVTVGVLSSFIYSLFSLIMVINGKNEYVERMYFEGVATIIFFVKLGRIIEHKSNEKTKEAIEELVQITPDYAFLKTKNGEKKITIDEVKKGDILICKEGEKIAVDGFIVSGKTHVDESFITGESTPSKKREKDYVVAGSMNIDGYIEYRAEKIGRNSTISEIVRLVIESTNTKAKISALSDKVSSYFVPSIFIIAFITFISYLLYGYEFNESLISFVSVLVVACPCALGLATPLAIVISEGKCAKSGILIKSSQVLENANLIDTIVFDKTGTLTYGKLKVSKIYNYSNYSESELIKIVSMIEKHSNHPIASAFKNEIVEDKVDNVTVIGGIGLKAKINKDIYYLGNNKIFRKVNIENNYKSDEEELANDGNTIIYVIENRKIIGLIGVKDILRENIKETIDELIRRNINVIMLTGDNEKTANIVACNIGIKDVRANVLPKDKTNIIKELSKSGKKVMMVGDGINDAASLASSLIGVSIKSGTDIASNSADVILMNDNINNIIKLIDRSKKTIKIIKENLFWAFIYNIIMIPIAIGLFKSFSVSINPMISSISMMISSLTVVINSLRLRR